MAKRIYPFLPAFCFSDSFNSLAKIKKVAVPNLFIHSRNDEIVPFSLAKKLYETAEKPKQMAKLIGGHNTAYMESQEKYSFRIKSFIDSLFD